MENKVLFGLLGAPRSGKDAVCKFLEQNYGFKSIAFADFIKEEYGISKDYFESMKDTDDIEELRKLLWAFSASKKAVDPLYFINKAMEFVASVNSPVIINDIRTPDELHAVFTRSIKNRHFRRVYLVERGGIDSFDANDVLVDSKLPHSLIEEYAKYYTYKDELGIKYIHNNTDLETFNQTLNKFFHKELIHNM